MLSRVGSQKLSRKRPKHGKTSKIKDLISENIERIFFKVLKFYDNHKYKAETVTDNNEEDKEVSLGCKGRGPQGPQGPYRQGRTEGRASRAVA